jgi:hypothetical protein
MVLSRRERFVLIGTLAAVGLFALDQIVLERLWAARTATKSQRDRLAGELTTAHALLTDRDLVTPKWQQMIRTGMKSDSGEAESQVYQSLQSWARAEGLPPLNIKAERLTEKSQLPQIAFTVSGTGNMRGVARLLWRVQTAGIPIKVTEATINAHQEGRDDLTFTLKVSTVYSAQRLSPATAASSRPNPSGGA